MSIIVSEIDSAISCVTFNRPERCNTFSTELLESLAVELERLENSPEKSVVIFRGSGRTFCGGLDLSEAAISDDRAARMARLVVENLIRIRESRLTTIAAVQNAACAGGAAIAVICDFTIASADSRIGFPEVRRGLKPALLFPVLRRLLPVKTISELIISGEPITAGRAKELGLVQHVVPPSELDAKSLELAATICLGAPQARVAAKQLVNSAFWGPEFAREMYGALEEHHDSWRSPEARKGISAFLEKRTPNWP